MELLEKLGLDWKLLIAQIVNFAILVGVLSALVYKPLLRLLDDRRERIRKSMDDVAKIDRQKKEMDELRVLQLKKIDEEAGALLAQSKRDAEKMRDDILANAKKEADSLLEKGRAQLASERETVLQEVQGTLAGMIVSITQKILEREFSPSDQKRILTMLERDIPSLVR